MHYTNKTFVLQMYKNRYFMQIKEKLKQIGKDLPRGSYKVIAERTGLRHNTICDIFAGRANPTITNLRKIMPIAKELLKETKEMLSLFEDID